MKGLVRALIVLVILCAAGLPVAIYWPTLTGGGHLSRSASTSADQDGSSPTVLGQFTRLDPPRPAPEVNFTRRDGSPLRLADFHGHWVLINLWATWCAPCVREMPSLDQLQARLGNRLTVLAISEDRGGPQIVDPFLERLGLKTLAIYLDPKGGAGQALKVRGLPTSVLIDGKGRIRAQLEGATEWTSPEILATLDGYLRQEEAADGGASTSSERR
jgi:thiol-disulfide isomerase/thioredoxin